MSDKFTGQSQGFGFVEMSSNEEDHSTYTVKYRATEVAAFLGDYSSNITRALRKWEVGVVIVLAKSDTNTKQSGEFRALLQFGAPLYWKLRRSL